MSIFCDDQRYITRRMTTKIQDDINAERQRQNETWGYNDHHTFKWLTIITEEMGDASAAALKIDLLERKYNETDDIDSCDLLVVKELQETLRKELIQVAASTVAMLEHLDRKIERDNEKN